MAPLLSLLLSLIIISTAEPLLRNMCPQPEVHRYLVLSQAQIEKSKSIRFEVTLFDSPISINRTVGGLVLKGNFSRLVLKNTKNNSVSIFEGRQMQFKVPANHVFNLKKIPDLQIQINHVLVEGSQDSPIQHLMLSQTYMSTPFKSSINTVVSRHLSPSLKEGDVLQTDQIIKLLEGFPMLMYRGTNESYPCRTDLFCLLKRQYQLISPEDLTALKQYLLSEEISSSIPKKAFKRKTLTEIYPLPQRKRSVERSEKAESNEDEL